MENTYLNIAYFLPLGICLLVILKSWRSKKLGKLNLIFVLMTTVILTFPATSRLVCLLPSNWVGDCDGDYTQDPLFLLGVVWILLLIPTLLFMTLFVSVILLVEKILFTEKKIKENHAR